MPRSDKGASASHSGGRGHNADLEFGNADFVLSAGLTCVSVLAMPAERPTIHWLARESASVYGCNGHLHCALRRPCIYTGNEGSSFCPSKETFRQCVARLLATSPLWIT
jgi:hypothetical protein